MADRDEIDRNTGAVHRRDFARIVRLIIILALVGALIVVALDNRKDARIGYAVGDASLPVWSIIVSSAVGGLIIGWLMRHRSRRNV